MGQSLAKIYLHIVFSTKGRQTYISKEYTDDLHAYIVGVLSKIGSYTEAIYANPEHIHILNTLPRTISVADLIQKIKTPSSKWLKEKGIEDFDWQDGYGAFSLSYNGFQGVKKYILNQENHHKNKFYKDEMRSLYKKYKIDFDEKYVWD